MVLNLGTRVFTIVGCKTNREHLLSEVTVTYRKNGFLRGFWTAPVKRERHTGKIFFRLGAVSYTHLTLPTTERV